MDLLRQKLIEKQGTASDRAFAARLGVGHTLWTETKKGKYAIGIKILAGAAAAFPDLHPHLLDFLKHQAPNRRIGA